MTPLNFLAIYLDLSLNSEFSYITLVTANSVASAKSLLTSGSGKDQIEYQTNFAGVSRERRRLGT